VKALILMPQTMARVYTSDVTSLCHAAISTQRDCAE